jgi:hypothetical protein
MIPRERQEEVVRQNHPGPLATLETFWWNSHRGSLNFAVLDRTFLNRVRRSLGEKNPILILLSGTIFHSDGIREECWINENGEPQASFLSTLPEEPVSGTTCSQHVVMKAFPSAFQAYRTRLFRVIMVVSLILLFLISGFAPWLGVLRNRRDLVQMKINMQDRLVKIIEWEKGIINGIEEPSSLIPETGLEYPWNFLSDLATRTSKPLGLELLTLDKSYFRLRLWVYDPQELTASYSQDSKIVNLEFSEYPQDEGNLPGTGMVSLSLTGGYLNE